MPEEYGQNRRNSRYLRGSNASFGTIQLPPRPVGVLLPQLVDQAGPPPASGLVDVPRHLDGDDVAELARLQVLVGLLVALRAPALRADLHDLAGVLDRLAKGARVLHGVGHGLLDVGVASGAHGLDAMLRMLEVGGRDDDSVDVLAGVEFVVVPTRDGGSISELLQLLAAGLAPQAPDVGDGDQLEVHVRRRAAGRRGSGCRGTGRRSRRCRRGRGRWRRGCGRSCARAGWQLRRSCRQRAGIVVGRAWRTPWMGTNRLRGGGARWNVRDERTRHRRAAQCMTGRTTPALAYISLRLREVLQRSDCVQAASEEVNPLGQQWVPEGARWFLTMQSGCVTPFEVLLSPCSCEHAV